MTTIYNEKPNQEIIDYLSTIYNVVEQATPEMVKQIDYENSGGKFALDETAFMPAKTISLPHEMNGIKHLVLLSLDKNEFITFIPAIESGLVPYRLAEYIKKS